MISSTGCTVCQSVRRTLIQEPIVYSWKWDRGQSLDVYRDWADQAWREHFAQNPEICSNDDYALGFRDGFVDYVYAGGTGEPPPVPPRHFWNVDYRTAEGHAAADQWFAGYRHGAAVARNGGYRAQATLKSSLRTGQYHHPYGHANQGAPSPYAVGQPMPIPAEPVPAPAGENIVNPYRDLVVPNNVQAPDGDDARLPEAIDATDVQPHASLLDDQGVRNQLQRQTQPLQRPSVEIGEPSFDVGPLPTVPNIDSGEPPSGSDPLSSRNGGTNRPTIQAIERPRQPLTRPSVHQAAQQRANRSQIAEHRQSSKEYDRTGQSQPSPSVIVTASDAPSIARQTPALSKALPASRAPAPHSRKSMSFQPRRTQSVASTKVANGNPSAAYVASSRLHLGNTASIAAYGEQTAESLPPKPKQSRPDTLMVPSTAVPRPRAYSTPGIALTTQNGHSQNVNHPASSRQTHYENKPTKPKQDPKASGLGFVR